MGQFFLSGGAGRGPSVANAPPVHMLKYALFDAGIAQNDNVNKRLALHKTEQASHLGRKLQT